MRIYFALIFLLISISAFSQSITGVIRDSLKNEPISYASIRLLSAKDSTYITGAITRDKGEFKISQGKGEYILDISCMGFARYMRSVTVEERTPVNLGAILLQTADYTLSEALVTASVPDIVVRGDTIEYNADAYRVGDDALLQDLVRRIPGIEVSSNGKLVANGKVISKILIDGKEFFDNDIDLALKNLPASMVNKLQLFKEESDMSKVTGFKDGDTQNVLNLTVKQELKKTVFGNVKAGYGTNDRYSNNINANYMADDNQYAVIANMNNVTDNFEYSGVSSQFDGITKEKNLYFKTNLQRSKNLAVGANIRYENEDNLYKVNSNTETFIDGGNRMSQQNSSTRSQKRNLMSSMNLKWTPDSLTTIFARMNVSTGTSDDIRRGDSKSYVENSKDTTSGWSDYITSGGTYNVNASIIFGRKLSAKGRNISLSLNGGTRGNDGHGTNYSTTEYQGLGQTKIIDQVLSLDNSSNNWGLLLSYVEPLDKHNSIQLSYSYRREYAGRDKLTFKRDGEGEYTVIDTAYTRNTKAIFVGQKFNIGFQSLHDKIEFTAGFSIDPSTQKNKSTVTDSIIENQKESVVNFSPTLKLTYTPKSNITFDLDYYGTTEHPTLRQLSSDTIIIDALSKTYGNPDLKASYDNNLSMYYQISNYEKGSYFMITASGNYIVNKIVDYTVTDAQGNVESSYRNVKGNWGMNGGIIFSTPLRNKKFTLDNSSFGYFVRNIGYSNGNKNVTYNLTLSETFSMSYKSEKFDQRLQLNASLNITRNNNLGGQQDLGTANYGFKSSTMVRLPWDLSVQNELSYVYNRGYSTGFQKSEMLWNLAVSKQFLKKKATAKVQCYDLLADRNNLVRTVSGNFISDTKTNMIGRYVLLSFNYRFNFANLAAKKAAEAEEDDTNYLDY